MNSRAHFSFVLKVSFSSQKKFPDVFRAVERSGDGNCLLSY